MNLARARAAAAVGIVVMAALIQLTTWLRSLDWRADPRQSELSAHETRFEALRTALPRDATVGFLMAAPPEAVLAHPVKAAYLFRLQYTLAPVLVLNDPNQPLMVADLEALAHDEAVFESDDGENMIVLPEDRAPLALVRDFGTDTMLFRRTIP
jgi:hypothetical protein